MADDVIVKQCSPTLAGLKTGNLFSVNYHNPAEIKTAVRNLNRRLSGKGLRLIPVRYGQKQALLYMYRPSCLRRDLADREAVALLSEMGYITNSPEKCLVRLIHKCQNNSQFPHEIGLFLGYPPEDVRGFIQHSAQHCKCTGCWKVYGDEEKAQKTFHSYKACTRQYCEQWLKGKSIEELAVCI